MELSSEQIEDIVKEVRLHENGKINYSDFLSATLQLPSYLTEERLWMLFKQFDLDDRGFLTSENIKTVLDKKGIRISVEEIKDFIDTYDLKNDGKLSFGSFKALMLSDIEVLKE